MDNSSSYDNNEEFPDSILDRLDLNFQSPDHSSLQPTSASNSLPGSSTSMLYAKQNHVQCEQSLNLRYDYNPQR